MAALFARLSDNSRRDRFLTAMPRLSTQMLDKLVDGVDGHRHVAFVLIATPPGQRPTFIGVARFVRNRDDPTSAEIAVTVDDAWHELGAGTLLLQTLAAAAHREGIGSFTAAVRTTNTRALRLVQHIGAVTEWEIVGATVECRITLPHTVPQLVNSAA